MSSMEEAVARAIALARCKAGGAVILDSSGVPLQWQDHVDLIWRQYSYDAREAMRAMREPTEAMLSAGGEPDGQDGFSDAGTHWRLMIAAALGEKTP